MHYVYDIADRLSRVESAEGSVIGAYYYDPFGRRLWKEVNGQRTYFLYAEEGLVAESDGSGNPIRQYGYEPGSEWTTSPLYMRTAAQYYFYQNDHLGTPQKLIGATGQVVWGARYEAFGRAEARVSDIENPLRFPGQYYDQETGLHYNLLRYHDPSTGRYITSDLIGLAGGLNTYGYVNSNPLYWSDPRGLVSVFFGGAMDGRTGLVRDPYNRYYRGIDPYSSYFEWDQYDDAYEFIKKYAKDNPCEPINLVGHSWGGDSATRVAQRLIDEGYHVNMLITVDPVGGRIPGFDDDYPARNLTNGTTTWYNVYADPIGSYDRTDFIAGLGAWNDVDAATISLPVNAHHGQFGRLFEGSGAADFYRNNARNGCGCK